MVRMMLKRATPFLSLLALAACGPKKGQLFSGHWIIEGNDAAFQPCGSTDKWWATVDSSLMATATVDTVLVYVQNSSGSDTLAPPVPELPPVPPPAFLRVRGDTSPLGSYGPGGVYKRHLTVHQMVDTSGHCP